MDAHNTNRNNIFKHKLRIDDMTPALRWHTAAIIAFLAFAASFHSLDLQLAIWIKSHIVPELTLFFRKLTLLGQSEWYLVPGILIFLVFRKQNPALSRGSLFIFSSVALSGLAADLLKYLLPRARPAVYFHENIYGFKDFTLWHGWENSWNSFPSGHSATAFSAAAVFSILFPKFRFLFFSAAAIIALSRIAVGKHYLSDVIAGSFLGFGTAVLLFNLYFRPKPDAQAIP